MAGPLSSRPYVWQEVPWAEGQVLTRGTEAGLPVLTWGRANREQLATVRQLRELGLRPGGAEPVAVLAFGHRTPGRREVEHAALYRIADAVPKRTATPAQRDAIKRALAARRTCERCGAEQDYYLSTVSRQCGPCEDATGFWDDGRDVEDAAGREPEASAQATRPASPLAAADRVAEAHDTSGSVIDSAHEASDEAALVPAADAELGAASTDDLDSAADWPAAPDVSADVHPPASGTGRGSVVGAGRLDAGRLAEVYAAYWPQVRRAIGSQVRAADQAAVEDLAQATFLRAWPYLHQVHLGDEAVLRRWLNTVARHTVARHYRHRSARKRAAETLVAPDVPVWGSARAIPAGGATTAADEAATVPQRMILAAALEQLPPDTRQILRLRFLEDLPINEVAAQLGKARATVVRHTAAGLAALREQLAEQLGEHTTDVPNETGRAHHRSLGTPRRGPLGVSLAEYVRTLDPPPATTGQVEADPALAGMSLRDYGAARLPSAMQGLAAGTAYPYLAGWRQRIVPTLGDLPVRSIDATAVDAAMRCWASKQSSPSTVTNTRSVLRRVLDQAVRDGVLDRNPARELTRGAGDGVDPDASTGIEARPQDHPAGVGMLAAPAVEPDSDGADSAALAGEDWLGELQAAIRAEDPYRLVTEADLNPAAEAELEAAAAVAGDQDDLDPEDYDYQVYLDSLDCVSAPDGTLDDDRLGPEQCSSEHKAAESFPSWEWVAPVHPLGRDAEHLARTEAYPQLRELMVTLPDGPAQDAVPEAGEPPMTRDDLRPAGEQAAGIGEQLTEFRIAKDRRTIGYGPLADALREARHQQIARTADSASTAAAQRDREPAEQAPPVACCGVDGPAAPGPDEGSRGYQYDVLDEADDTARADGSAPTLTDTAQAVERAHQAVRRAIEARTDAPPGAADAERAEQLARWHADDQAAEQAGDLGAEPSAEHHREFDGVTQ